MERELPKPGDHWRHFKGGEYAIVAIAQYSPQWQVVVYTNKELTKITEQLAIPSGFVVKDVNTEIFVEVINQEEKWIVRPRLDLLLPVKNPNSIGWARSLDNFMGIVSSPHGDKAINCQRFERTE